MIELPIKHLYMKYKDLLLEHLNHPVFYYIVDLCNLINLINLYWLIYLFMMRSENYKIQSKIQCIIM